MNEKAMPAPDRLLSLDAYRGLIMVSLAFGGFGLANTAQNHLEAAPDSSFWAAVAYQFSHAQWVGCSFWDLIQPSFMFMVGVSMAYSYAKRAAMGDSQSRMLGHAVYRSIALVLLGVFLSSGRGSGTNWTFTNVLSQIGLGYTFLFLFWGKSFRTQAIGAGAVLLGTWMLFVCYPGSGLDLEKGAPGAGVTPDWAKEYLTGVGASWHKNANFAHAVDLRFLNWFPRGEPFTANEGGYQTLNFLPALATMVFGLMCGGLLRSNRGEMAKLKILLIAGIAGLVAGQVLHFAGFSPLVKRIWTPSWAIFSTGWCCLILGFLYYLIDIRKLRGWAFPLVVVGMNSIAMYFMGQLLKSWVGERLQRHLGKGIFEWCGAMQEPLLQSTMTGLVFWLVCWWMYRRKIFLRI